MGFGSYLVRRTGYNVLMLILIAVVNFVIFRLIPSDPVAVFIQGKILKPQQIQALYRLYGLDKPLWEQFFYYMAGLFTGNFGFSFATTSPVIDGILPRIPGTLILLGTSTAISIILGVLIGVLSASRRGGILDGGVQGFSLFTYALPVFWLGYILLLVFYIDLHWFPFGGTSNDNPPPIGLVNIISDRLWHLTLPMITLVVVSIGGWALLMRNSLMEVLSEDYIVTARAKGLTERAVLYKHALRNALLPIVTQVALTLGFILSGAVLTETVFTWYGLGRYIFDSLNKLDYPVLQAIFFLIAVTVVLANFVADIIYGVLDPRIRY